MNDIYQGDCREVRTVLADNTIDTIITDPPYELGFMGKKWDASGIAFNVQLWKDLMAVTKPGGFLLAFGGTRTFHRMACAIEDAGWEMRDCMMWLYGSGFPKSLDISKAIDKVYGAKREPILDETGKQVWTSQRQGPKSMFDGGNERPATYPATVWGGWGTALKPAWEPIIVAMKPLDGTFAENAEKWEVSGINIDGARVATDELRVQGRQTALGATTMGGVREGGKIYDKGRWPANLVLDEEAGKMLDEQTGELRAGIAVQRNRDGKVHNKILGARRAVATEDTGFGGSGGASRFFYCAKASSAERNGGLDELEAKSSDVGALRDAGRGKTAKNIHPTVKPLKLMEYLCTLTKTPTGGIVLDPFAGSGSTLLAAKNTGRQYVGIEQNSEYVEIIERRLGLK